MQLNDLIPGRPDKADRTITKLSADSRAVVPGTLFAALPGSRTDGTSYIDAAVAAGAVAVITAAPVTVPDDVALIVDDNPRRLLAQVAARFYGTQPRYLVAVTGTNGKTSTVYFVQQLWENLGHKAASLGTLGLRGAGLATTGAMTTPDPVTLHAQLADLAGQGYDHVAMEASSHGLAQYRLDGVRVAAAGFTNLSRDHLDYHPTMDDYLEAKARLFHDILPADGVAVLNADVPEYETLRAQCRGRVIAYGRRGDIRMDQRKPLPQGQALILTIGTRTYEVLLPLVGAFQAMNALCALGLAMAEAPDDEKRTAELVAALARLRGAPGRLQYVPGHADGAAVYVDYAHTPDALDNVLDALRPHTAGRLFCVFGCGGDRDPGKRPLMGRIAAQKADHAIVTDDNPRSENPAAIRAAVIAGMDGEFTEIGGRGSAIAHAIAMLRAGDVLVIAGKGHEQGQIIGDVTEAFDDVAVAAKAIETINHQKQTAQGQS